MKNSNIPFTDRDLALSGAPASASAEFAILTPLTAGFTGTISGPASFEVLSGRGGTLVLGIRPLPDLDAGSTISHLPSGGPTSPAAPTVSTPTSVRTVLPLISQRTLAADGNALTNADRKLGSPLRQHDYAAACVAEGWPTVSDLVERHGSWKAALIAAGLQPAGRGRPKLSERVCRDAVDSVAARVGVTPEALTRNEYVKNRRGKEPVAITVQRHLGCWTTGEGLK